MSAFGCFIKGYHNKKVFHKITRRNTQSVYFHRSTWEQFATGKETPRFNARTKQQQHGGEPAFFADFCGNVSLEAPHTYF